MASSNLHNAKKARNDEFYTQFQDIQKEVNAYLEYNPTLFKDKTILLPCDDPEWSNFTKFFAQNFETFGLKKLISTSYAADSKSSEIDYEPTLFESIDPRFDVKKTRAKGKIFTLTKDENKDGKINIDDLKWNYLEDDGDFRSEEVKLLRDEADFIITNPPFSLFREFVTWIMEANKKFLIIGNLTAVKYSETYPYLEQNKMWLGVTITSGDRLFGIPNSLYDPKKVGAKDIVIDGKHYISVVGVRWYTNIEHGRLHEKRSLMTEADNIKYSKHKEVKGIGYKKYDNYDAIEVPFFDAIPSDYKGIMGVPISFMDKYNPDQFEILGLSMKAGFGLQSNKFYDSYKEITQEGKFTGSSGKKTNGNPMISGKPQKGNYYIDENGNCAYSLYDRFFIRIKQESN